MLNRIRSLNLYQMDIKGLKGTPSDTQSTTQQELSGGEMAKNPENLRNTNINKFLEEDKNVHQPTFASPVDETSKNEKINVGGIEIKEAEGIASTTNMQLFGLSKQLEAEEREEKPQIDKEDKDMEPEESKDVLIALESTLPAEERNSKLEKTEALSESPNKDVRPDVKSGRIIEERKSEESVLPIDTQINFQASLLKSPFPNEVKASHGPSIGPTKAKPISENIDSSKYTTGFSIGINKAKKDSNSSNSSKVNFNKAVPGISPQLENPATKHSSSVNQRIKQNLLGQGILLLWLTISYSIV
eukprot:TRINITY_DN2517_c0_g1_i1.p2 TRINITY_DN2517_c0_g1~~TRINITY_DN2517_c0_g1_i1.p2  ORF type:complete len:302 (-),score=36.66 TRINITY_DN2517_c0_g1_i1:1911-2816(-)